MTLRKSLFLVLALGMIATLVACGSGSSGSGGGGGGGTTPTALAISSPAGGTESAAINNTFGALSVLVTNSSGAGLSGVSVTFTVTAGASGASGAFSGSSTTTDTETTGSNGVATTSQTLTANATAGTFTVTASSGTLTPVTFTLTNTTTVSPYLPAGNYVYYVAGTDTGAGGCSAGPCSQPYFLAGVFTVNNSNTITGGEQDFSDYNYIASAEQITGGTVGASTASANGDTNLTITLNTGDPNIGLGGSTGAGTGTLVLNVSMTSSGTKGLLMEYDTWATGTGELNYQGTSAPTSVCASTPCGFAFTVGGLDYLGTYDATVGGILVVDGAGTISGSGSVYDINDGGVGTYPNNAVSASTVTGPDSLGFVTFTLNSTLLGSPGLALDGYMIDSSHIRLVELYYNPSTQTSDGFGGTTGGTAIAQSQVGGFASTALNNSTQVMSLFGGDTSGPLDVAGQVTFSSGGSLSGSLSYNDTVAISAQGGNAITGGIYSVDSSGTGRVTVTGLTDGTETYDLQLYLTGGNKALVMSMDAENANPDVLGGISQTQASGSFGLSSITGNYAIGLGGFASPTQEVDNVGVLIANGTSTLAGFTDQNNVSVGGGLTANQSLNGTLSTTSTNGVFDVAGSGGSQFTVYLIDTTQGVVIETDTSGNLVLGYFANQ